MTSRGYGSRYRCRMVFSVEYVGRFPGEVQQIVAGADGNLYATVWTDGLNQGAVYRMMLTQVMPTAGGTGSADRVTAAAGTDRAVVSAGHDAPLHQCPTGATTPAIATRVSSGGSKPTVRCRRWCRGCRAVPCWMAVSQRHSRSVMTGCCMRVSARRVTTARPATRSPSRRRCPCPAKAACCGYSPTPARPKSSPQVCATRTTWRSGVTDRGT